MSDKEKKRDSKFQFFTEEEEVKKDTPKKGVPRTTLNEIPDKEDSHVKKNEYVPVEEKENTSTIDISNVIHAVEEKEEKKPSKIYFSFQARVTFLVICVLALFITGCVFIIQALYNNEIKEVSYEERADTSYEVCLSSYDPYQAQCLKEGETYLSSNVSNIPLEFHYEANMEEEVPYNFSYYVVLTHEIYNILDQSKAVYEDENLIVEKTGFKKHQNPASIDVNVEIDYPKYQNFVLDYQNKYSMQTTSSLIAILYVDDGEKTRNVSEVHIPLGLEQFQVLVNDLKEQKNTFTSEVKEWSNHHTMYVVVGCILVLLSLLFLFRLTRLVLKTVSRKSKYQQYLTNILNEYDRLIVTARDGYTSSVEKRVLKVASFDELLDARSILNKPIVYSKINNIKSEFLVEDEEIIYKYVLKEADLDEK